jgi:hypothetical protein
MYLGGEILDGLLFVISQRLLCFLLTFRVGCKFRDISSIFIDITLYLAKKLRKLRVIEKGTIKFHPPPPRNLTPSKIHKETKIKFQ